MRISKPLSTAPLKCNLQHVNFGNVRGNENTKKTVKIMKIVEFSILVEISEGLKNYLLKVCT